MSDTFPSSAAERLRAMLGDVADSIGGGEDVSLDDIEPMEVTPETEAAYKEAQQKKAEQESDGNSNNGYG